MTAERDRNPPEEWADKVTANEDSKSGEASDEKEQSEELGFKVRDKRHWVEGVDENEADEAQKRLEKPSYVQALEDELKQKDDTLREYISQYKAAKAGMNDAIARIEREKSREVNFRIAELARTFLSILDDLDAAIKAMNVTKETEPVIKGLDLITQRIHSSLKEIGIEQIDAVGKPHDPNFHDAVAIHDVESAEKDGIVVEEFKKGYRLGEVLVRPSTVVVGKIKQ